MICVKCRKLDTLREGKERVKGKEREREEGERLDVAPGVSRVALPTPDRVHLKINSLLD